MVKLQDVLALRRYLLKYLGMQSYLSITYSKVVQLKKTQKTTAILCVFV